MFDQRTAMLIADGGHRQILAAGANRVGETDVRERAQGVLGQRDAGAGRSQFDGTFEDAERPAGARERATERQAADSGAAMMITALLARGAGAGQHGKPQRQGAHSQVTPRRARPRSSSVNAALSSGRPCQAAGVL